MSSRSHPLVAAALVILLAINVATAATARPAAIIIHASTLRAKTKLQWKIWFAHKDKETSVESDDLQYTSNGYMTFKVPYTPNCGDLRAAHSLSWVEGDGADHRCLRPTLDINSAYSTHKGGVYCAESMRHDLFFGHAKCEVKYTHRAIVVDDKGNAMRLRNPQDWRLCGSMTGEDLKRVAESAKRMRLG